MSCYLLDVNVLIALTDTAHIQHDKAHEWFGRVGSKSFATCPITQNGLVRILGNPRYPNSPGPPSAVLETLRGICALPGHHFWPDDLDLTAQGNITDTLLSHHERVTDTYLLALAKSKGGKLASFDSKLVTQVVPQGQLFYALIDS